MKPIIILLVTAVLLLTTEFTYAQAPQGFNYQAVVRDAAGNPITNGSVSLRFSIREGEVGGTIVYQELHLLPTNTFGLLTAIIGNGTPVSGDFTTIKWGNFNHFLQVEADPNGGNNYSDLGTTQFLSVPYALSAKTADAFTGGINSLWATLNNNIYNTNSGNVGIGTTTPASLLHIRTPNHGLTIQSESSSGSDTPFFVLTNGGSKAGMIVRANGNVGIGTTTPGDKLDIHDGNLKLTYNGLANSGILMAPHTAGYWGWMSSIGFRDAIEFGFGETIGNDTRMVIKGPTGNVGIGIINPTAKLDVRTAADGLVVQSASSNSGDTPFLVRSDNGATECMIVRANGNVGIGTTSPQSRLAVNGTITCKEVNVTLSGFPDYVFRDDYSLKSLSQVESYIKENGHLEGIPSEREVVEKGIGLGQLNSILVEKIEELTLYAIDLQKQLDGLKQQLDQRQ